MCNLLFQPWIGANYGNTNLGKLLIIGESHYFYHDETDYASFTIRTIQNLGTNRDNDFYIKVGHVFNPDNYLDIWSKVAFANAIQYPFEDSDERPTNEHFETVEPAIREYLELTSPSKTGQTHKFLPEIIR